MMTGLRATPPPSSCAGPGARCILGKGLAPSSRSPWGSGWVLRQGSKATLLSMSGTRQEAWGADGHALLLVWGSPAASLTKEQEGGRRSAAAALGIRSGLGVRRTPDIFPLWAAWTWQGTFSLWEVGRVLPGGVSGAHRLSVQNPPMLSVAVLSSATVQGAQEDPQSRHGLQGGGWFLPSSSSANP